MGGEPINALECLKSWYHGLISATHEDMALFVKTLAALRVGNGPSGRQFNSRLARGPVRPGVWLN